MTLLALGINHKTAPVALRERVTFGPEKIDHALEELLKQPQVNGGVVLSTCNRTELYLSLESQERAQEQLVKWLCDFHGITQKDLQPSLYWHQDDRAVSHLMRVASGLDSLVLGEPQILGQVKRRLHFRKVTIRYQANLSVFSKNHFLLQNVCVQKPILERMQFLWHLLLVHLLVKYLNHLSI